MAIEHDKFLIEYMKEHYSRVRQHETLETATTTFLTAAAGVILGFQFKEGSGEPSVVIGALLFLVGLANFQINESHYFGNRFHNDVIGQTRRSIERMAEAEYTDLDQDKTKRGSYWDDNRVTAIRGRAIDLYPTLKKGGSVGSYVHKRLQFIPCGVMLVGILLCVWAVVT